MKDSSQSPVVLSCIAAYGSGGMGQHFSEIVERFRRQGPIHYFTSRPRKGDNGCAQLISDRLSPWLCRYTPLRFSPGGTAHVMNDRFDRAVSRRLTSQMACFVGFSGQSLHSLRRAKALGCARLALVAPTCHVSHVAKQHEKARRYCDVEPDWLNRAQLRKSLAEYELADVIYVGSDYARQSFMENGVSPERLSLVDYPIEPRFLPDPSAQKTGFQIVYTGSVCATKGIPVLLDAFARIDWPDARLTMVGGSATRGMRKYLQERLRRDPRIQISPGDPLPHLQRAHLYIHPSFQDGYGYAPMEAMACGVPVIVTEDTGMKQHVRSGVNGYVVPTGDSQAIADAIHVVARNLGRS